MAKTIINYHDEFEHFQTTWWLIVDDSSALIDQCAGDSKKLLNLVKFLCNDPNVSALPAHDDPVLLANNFWEFFPKKLNLLRIPSRIFNLIVLVPMLLIQPWNLIVFRFHQLTTFANLSLPLLTPYVPWIRSLQGSISLAFMFLHPLLPT